MYLITYSAFHLYFNAFFTSFSATAYIGSDTFLSMTFTNLVMKVKKWSLKGLTFCELLGLSHIHSGTYCQTVFIYHNIVTVPYDVTYLMDNFV